MTGTKTFIGSTVGRKLVVAVTGIMLFGYLVLHVLGNMQIFAGPTRIDHYAELLRTSPPLLWGARIVLLAAVVVHIWLTVLLTLENRGARPRYRGQVYRETDVASRIMIWSGLVLLAFIVFHILDLTVGTVNPGFRAGHVFDNVIASLSRLPVAVFYLVAVTLLGFHLYHALWSLFQTLGLNHPRYNRWRRVFSVVFAVLVATGFASIPLAVMAGLLP